MLWRCKSKSFFPCEIGRCLQPGSWPQTLAQPPAGMPADEDVRLEGDEVVRFWTRERDLAAVVFYVRKTGPASIEYIVLPQLYASATDRTWQAGTCRPVATNGCRCFSFLHAYSNICAQNQDLYSDLEKGHAKLDLTGANWSVGTVVKMPAYTNLTRAAGIPNMRWYSGVLSTSYPPSSARNASMQPSPAGKPPSCLHVKLSVSVW